MGRRRQASDLPRVKPYEEVEVCTGLQYDCPPAVDERSAAARAVAQSLKRKETVGKGDVYVTGAEEMGPPSRWRIAQEELHATNLKKLAKKVGGIEKLIELIPAGTPVPDPGDRRFFAKLAHEIMKSRFEDSRGQTEMPSWLDTPAQTGPGQRKKREWGRQRGVGKEMVEVWLTEDGVLSLEAGASESKVSGEEGLLREVRQHLPHAGGLWELTGKSGRMSPLELMSSRIEPVKVGTRYTPVMAKRIRSFLEKNLGPGSAEIRPVSADDDASFVVGLEGLRQEIFRRERARDLADITRDVSVRFPDVVGDPTRFRPAEERRGFGMVTTKRMTKKERADRPALLEQFGKPLLQQPVVETYRGQEITEAYVMRLLDYPGEEILPYLVKLGSMLESLGGRHRPTPTEGKQCSEAVSEAREKLAIATDEARAGPVTPQQATKIRSLVGGYENLIPAYGSWEERLWPRASPPATARLAAEIMTKAGGTVKSAAAVIDDLTEMWRQSWLPTMGMDEDASRLGWILIAPGRDLERARGELADAEKDLADWQQEYVGARWKIKGLGWKDAEWFSAHPMRSIKNKLDHAIARRDWASVRALSDALRTMLSRYRKQLVQVIQILGNEQGYIVRTNPW